MVAARPFRSLLPLSAAALAALLISGCAQTEEYLALGEETEVACETHGGGSAKAQRKSGTYARNQRRACGLDE